MSENSKPKRGWSKWDGVKPIDADTYLRRVTEEDAYHARRREESLEDAKAAPRPKCDYCPELATTLTGEANGVLVCADHAPPVTPRYTSGLTPVEWTRLWRAAGNGVSRLGAAAEEFDRILVDRLIVAWDEGYTVGNSHNGRRDANPYRAAAPPQPEGEWS